MRACAQCWHPDRHTHGFRRRTSRWNTSYATNMSQSFESSAGLRLFLSPLTFGQIVHNPHDRSRAPPTPPRSEDGKPPSTIGDGRPNKKWNVNNANNVHRNARQRQRSETLEEMYERHRHELKVINELERLATEVAEYVLRDNSKSTTSKSLTSSKVSSD